MTIYRGGGGTGEATTDTDITEVREIMIEAKGYRDQASTSAANAASSASAAATSASNAASSASSASSSASSASSSASSASADAALAESARLAAQAAQAAAETAETNAETAETNAETAQAAAEAAQAAAEAVYDDFDDRYLGPKASDPTLDNDGNALQTGALYFNTTVPEMRVYTGSVWVDFSAGAAVSSFNTRTGAVTLTSSDVTTALTYTPLAPADIGSTVQGYDGDLAAIAAIAGTSGLLKKTAANTWSLDTSVYLTSYTETDPIYTASSWYGTTNNSSNWNTAYSWGNHASAGYALDSAVVKLTGDQTIAGTKTFSSTISGSISGNAGTVSNGVYTTGDQTVGGTKTFSSNPILSGGTVNGLAFLNASKVLTTGSALQFDGSNLGLGVTPSAWGSNFRAIELANGTTLTSTVSGVNAVLAGNSFNDGTGWKYKTSTGATYYNQAAGVHQWFTAPSGTAGNAISFTQAMTLTAQGNELFVGTASGFSATTGRGNFSVNGSSDSIIALGSNGTRRGYLYANPTQMNVGSDGILVFEASGSERARIDSSGNVGIGTSSPGAKLDVAIGTGGLVQQLSGASGVYTRLGTSTSSFYTVHNGSTDTFLYTQESAALRFGTAATERARIDSSGNLLVGTTSASPTASVGVRLTPIGEINATLAASTNASGTLNVYSTGASAYRFYVGMAGTVFATSTTISAISDQRLKENVQDLDVGLDAVMALRPRKFDWKEGKGKNIKGDRGWIAQEFEQVFPDMIDQWRDPSPEGEEPYKSVRADLIPVLVKAIQEQQAIIDAQSAALEQLKADVAALKGN